MPTPDPPLGSGKPEHKLLTEIADEMYATLTKNPGLPAITRSVTA